MNWEQKKKWKLKKLTKIAWAILTITQGLFVTSWGCHMLQDLLVTLFAWIFFNVWLWCVAVPILVVWGLKDDGSD
mgnify:CR=1 FL=1